jgi:hypothetical protein
MDDIDEQDAADALAAAVQCGDVDALADSTVEHAMTANAGFVLAQPHGGRLLVTVTKID